MAQNNFQHYSDLAEYTIFKPANTDWPDSVDNVQKALSMLGDWSRTDVGLPIASPTTPGIVAIATQPEVDAGVITNKFVSPATLKSVITRPDATTTVKGLTRYATNAEAAGFAIGNAAIVPSALGYVFTNVTANETRFGTIKRATYDMGQAGTDDTTAVTPKRVVEMIAAHSANPPSYTMATETNLGLVKLATSAQIQQGTLGDGYAISPKGLLGAKASESKFGVIRLSTASETAAGTLDSVAVSPKQLMALRGSTSQYGLVQLSGVPQSGQTAARADAVVFKTTTVNGKPLSGNITLGAGDVNAWSKGEADNRFMPKDRMVGNITRIEGATYLNYRGNNGSPDTWYCQSPWEGSSTVGMNVVCKFERNNDGGDNRIFQFYVRVNGQRQGGMLTLNIENTKGGRNGHSWRFEAYASGNFRFGNIPPGARVDIEPIQWHRVLHVDVLATFCTN